MKNCTMCGHQLYDDDKFCPECGTQVPAKRKTTFQGDVIKCPNCGEVVESFTIVCPSCGYEFRNVDATEAVKDFSDKLERIDLNRKKEDRHSILLNSYRKKLLISNEDEQKINLIRNYVIPNSKESLIEFMILATSNINVEVFGTVDDADKGEKAINEAWLAKMNQAMDKARVSMREDSDYKTVKELYDKCCQKIKRAKGRRTIKYVLLVGWIPLFAAFGITMGLISDANSKNAERKSLEATVSKVEEALSNNDFKLALGYADSLDYQGTDNAEEKNWDIQREYWTEKVITEAHQNGIELDYVPTEDVDNANKKNSLVKVPTDDFKKKQYKDIERQFRKAGFMNITTEKVPDLINGVLHKEGEVIEVSIDGDTEFDLYQKFDPDAEVVIRYHGFSDKGE